MEANFLYQKSLLQADAADLLKEKCFYDASITRYYYCCLQFMKYLLLKRYNTEEELEQAKRTSNSSSKEGIHSFYESEIQKLIVAKNLDKNDSKTFMLSFAKLKKMRVAADYQNMQHDSIASHTAQQHKNSLFAILNKLKRS